MKWTADEIRAKIAELDVLLTAMRVWKDRNIPEADAILDRINAAGKFSRTRENIRDFKKASRIMEEYKRRWKPLGRIKADLDSALDEILAEQALGDPITGKLGMLNELAEEIKSTLERTQP